MAFDPAMLVRLLHILAGAAWFGSTLFMVTMIGPAVRAGGPAGGAFMAIAMRRGGFGKFFGPAAGLTILTGLILYWMFDYASPFNDTRATILAIGALFGIFAFAEGMAVNLPTENKIKKIVKEMGPKPPTPEQAAALEALGKKMMKVGARGVTMISLALVLMLGRTLV